jgi:hypothetical protein
MRPATACASRPGGRRGWGGPGAGVLAGLRCNAQAGSPRARGKPACTPSPRPDRRTRRVDQPARGDVRRLPREGVLHVQRLEPAGAVQARADDAAAHRERRAGRLGVAEQRLHEAVEGGAGSVQETHNALTPLLTRTCVQERRPLGQCCRQNPPPHPRMRCAAPVAVHNAGRRRQQRRAARQLRLQRRRVGAAEALQVVHAVGGGGFSDSLQLLLLPA